MAVLAIAMSVWTAPAFAQDASTAPSDAAPAFAQESAPAPLGLKDADGAVAAAPPAAPDAAADNPLADPQADRRKKPNEQKDKTKKPPPPKDLPPLSLTLQPYSKAQRMGLAGGPPALAPSQIPPPAIAALPPPIPAKRPPPVDPKPFDPLGIDIGGLRLTPYVEEDIGYATNPSSLPGPTKGSVYESTQAGVGVQSNWGRSELKGSLTAGYFDYFTVPQANSPNASGTLDGRLDISRDFSIDAEGRFNIASQTPGSVTLPTGAVLAGNTRPLVETYGATLGGAQKFGDLTFSLHGTLDRTGYQNATLADGSIDDLASDDFTDYGLKGRVEYQISPVATPFAETVIDKRIYDSAIDASGFARTSTGILGRAGMSMAMTGELTGEASLGYGERQYEDARLPNLHGPLIDASLIWTATPLTTITLKTGTLLADTTNAGDSGAVSRSYSIDVSHALLRNFTIGATAGYATDVYAGAPLHDASTSFGVRADYNVTRDIMLRASATHSQFESSAPNTSFVANVFMLGLRLLR
jgi:hypothetical protein